MCAGCNSTQLSYGSALDKYASRIHEIGDSNASTTLAIARQQVVHVFHMWLSLLCLTQVTIWQSESIAHNTVF